MSRASWPASLVAGSRDARVGVSACTKVSPDRYVVITDKDMEAIAPKASRIIELTEFVKLDQIDPVYYDQSYYLAPAKGMEKSYQLLLQAMQEEGMVGIARFVLRNKEYLAAIRPVGNVLGMATMMFHDEVVPASTIEEQLPAETKVNDKELLMARQLIQVLASDFESTKYENEYYKQVLELIDRKAESEPIIEQKSESDKAVVDLMAALEASMKAMQKGKKPASAKKAKGA